MNLNAEPTNEFSKEKAEWVEQKVARLATITTDESLKEIGFSDEEVAACNRLQAAYEQLLSEAKNSSELLAQIEKRNIAVLRDSSFIKRFDSTEHMLDRMLGKVSGLNAAYIPIEKLREIMKRIGTDGKDSNEYPEVRTVLETPHIKGVIFLRPTSTAKSIYHEALHALQDSLGFNMDPLIEHEHAKREVEVSTIVIRLKLQGRLNEVTQGSISGVSKGLFNALIFTPHEGDILNELGLLAKNREKLRGKL